MKSDPAIEAVRETRHKISERFGHDTKALVEHYIALEEKYKGRMANKAMELTSNQTVLRSKD